jgi:serine/threonine-protein kinase
VALLLLAPAVAGCAGVDGQELDVWTLHVDDHTQRIELPIHLDDDLPRRVLTYHLTAGVDVDPQLRGQTLDLVIAYLPSQVALRVDGAAVRPVYSPDRETYRHVGPHRWHIPAEASRDGELQLELAVRHVWTQSAWLDVEPRLVPSRAQTAATATNRLLNDRGAWLGLIALSQMGLTFLAVFFWDRRRRAYLWFAIQALTASYYPAFVLGLTAGMGPKAELLLLAQCLSIAPIISVYYTHATFELGPPSRIWPLLLIVGALVPVPALFDPFLEAAYGTVGVIVCVGATIVYQLTIGARLLRRYSDRGIGLFFLCCWLALGGSAWVDLWAWIGGGEVLGGARPAALGLGLFGVFQSLLLSRSYIRSMHESEHLNTRLLSRLHELQQHQAEIQALNEELRQQVGRRSAQILAALAGSAGASEPHELQPDEVVEDRYRVVRTIATGGMGTVYEVERIHDHQRLALKAALGTQGVELARLAREAQLATRVRHPNVVAVVDADVARDGYVYLVMELVEGITLSKRRGAQPTTWSLPVLAQILRGLQALHAEGIVHRDLKPPNVLLSGDLEHAPQVKLTDFGISRGLSEGGDMPSLPPPAGQDDEDVTRQISDLPRAERRNRARTDASTEHSHSTARTHDPTPQLTRTGSITGTPSYVAPELARRGAKLGPAVDVFAFGVVAYRMLTGELPHLEPPMHAVLDGRDPTPHVSFATACPELPPHLAELLDACLSPTPDRRPSVDALLTAIEGANDQALPAEGRTASRLV